MNNKTVQFLSYINYWKFSTIIIEIEYENDNDFARVVLEAIFNSEAPHYFIDVEDEEDENGEDQDF